MDIGQHFLEGSVVTLKQPFIIIEKSLEKSEDNEDDAKTIPIKGFVKKKIIFKTRPKPIGLKRLLK